MSERDERETRDFWNRVATDWRVQVGDEGDNNRILCSDPVLWAFAGDVEGRRVLDAGCGTGYLSKRLHERGASVTGVDHAEEMLRIAREHYPEIDFRVDSCASLATFEDAEFDLVVSNYVLMDTPHLEATVASFFRVLRPGGSAVAVFSHPCFPQGNREIVGEVTKYAWTFPYFEAQKVLEPAWSHFKEDFIWFHRPLSDYWKAFRAAGFVVAEFEEPRLTEERYHLAENDKEIVQHQTRPYSVAFRLEKPLRG